MKWDQQIKNCVRKANSMIAWVTRNLILRELGVMRNVYKTIIRPHLEYCAQLWSPPACHGYWSNIIELENVQRRFTRLIDGIGSLPYSKRLEALQITTLAERRVRGDLIEVYKIINELVEYGQDIFKLTRSGEKIVSKLSYNIDSDIRRISKRFIAERVVKYWNLLPSFVRNSSSVTDFKINLEEYKKSNVLVDTGNFWEVSDQVLARIEGENYIEKKEEHIKYLLENPNVAKRKGINIF